MRFQRCTSIIIRLIFLLPLMLAATVSLKSQVISDVPDNRNNTRFMKDPSIISVRPGLTVAGFSNDNSGGLGLREILNSAMESTANPEHEILAKILNKAKEAYSTDPGFNQVEAVTNILQYHAFETLVSLILEQNGITSGRAAEDYKLDIRNHSELISELTNTLKDLTENDALVRKLPGAHPFDDYLIALRSYNNTSRLIDLYLGIENAYEYYDLDDSPLLSETNKSSLMKRFRDDIDILFKDGLKRTYELQGRQITEDELESGNRPLKGYFTLGYASMSVQAANNSNLNKLDGYTEMSISRARDSSEEGNRNNYWMFQTGNGQRFWAEGPYYLDFALKDAVIFWHAVRNNQELSPSLDPFFSDWFLNPVRWLAGLSTPDGSVPPLDDGNKKSIQSARLLRWSEDYGNAEIGRTFKTVHDKIIEFQSTVQSEDQYYLVEAAIPFHDGEGAEIGSILDTEEHQLISRFTDNRDRQHYISLTGEKGQAISAGEGHEQPDQLQLLYYVDHYSFLPDPGYDSGNPQVNSSWNGYLFTNSMQYNATDIRYSGDFVTYQNEGGLESPSASLSLLRKVSDHAEAELFYKNAAPAIDILSGTVDLNFQQPVSAESVYKRTVLIIKGPEPYLLDINDVTAIKGRNDFVMRYYGNSNKTDTQNGWFIWERGTDLFTSPNESLFIYTAPLTGNYSELDETVEIQEYENRNSSGEKEPYPIVRRSLLSTGETDRFTTAGIIKTGEVTPENKPRQFTHSSGLQYLIHQQDSETVDLFVFAADTLEQKRFLSVTSPPIDGLDFVLPAFESLGFTRLIKSGDTWIQDPDFTLNLSIAKAPNPPSNLEVLLENRGSGPVAVLSWTPPANEEVAYYEIWRQLRVAGTENADPPFLINTTEHLKYIDQNIAKDKSEEIEYRWYVKAANSDSLTSSPSNFTEWISISTFNPPNEFKLFNPYPNPVRNAGMIRYQLSEPSEVNLIIYDMLGRQVKTIIRENQSEGLYEVEWNTNGLASGIYIIQLRVESESGTSFYKSKGISVIK